LSDLTANSLVDKRSGNASEQILKKLAGRKEVMNVAKMEGTGGQKIERNHDIKVSIWKGGVLNGAVG